VSFLEKVEERLGTILTPDRIVNKVLKSIDRMRNIDPQDKIIWKEKVRKDHQEYLKILGKIPFDLPTILKIIEEDAKRMLEVLHKLDPGASLDDVALIANARYIRLNTDLEPLIITDDRDLLTCGHILSSCFGLTLSFLSNFEILRLVEPDENLIKQYCDYYTLKIVLGNIEDAWSKRTLERTVSNMMKKAKIACHPNLRSNDSLFKIIRR